MASRQTSWLPGSFFILPSFKALCSAVPLQLRPNQTSHLVHPYSFGHKLRLNPCSIFTSNPGDLDHLASRRKWRFQENLFPSFLKCIFSCNVVYVFLSPTALFCIVHLFHRSLDCFRSVRSTARWLSLPPHPAK